MFDQRPLCVLVPGISPFDITQRPTIGFANFGPVMNALAERGVDCRVADGIPPSGPVEARAIALSAALDRLGGRPCTLIGHSMGGLDARFLCAELDPARRVRAVVTLSTPHRGSSVADWALTRRAPFPWLVRALGRDGVADLTPEACARRNMLLADRPMPPIFSFAATRPVEELPGMLRALVPPVLDGEGPHDGLVTVASARWGEFLGTVTADHFELIGIDLTPGGIPLLGPLLRQRSHFDHVPLFVHAWERASAVAGFG
jgi:triacylglycerol lipase